MTKLRRRGRGGDDGDDDDSRSPQPVFASTVGPSTILLALATWTAIGINAVLLHLCKRAGVSAPQIPAWAHQEDGEEEGAIFGYKWATCAVMPGGGRGVDGSAACPELAASEAPRPAPAPAPAGTRGWSAEEAAAWRPGGGGVEEVEAYLGVLAGAHPHMRAPLCHAAAILLQAQHAPPEVLCFVAVVQSRHLLELLCVERLGVEKVTQLREGIATLTAAAEEGGSFPPSLESAMSRVLDNGNNAVHKEGMPTAAHANSSLNGILAVLVAEGAVREGEVPPGKGVWRPVAGESIEGFRSRRGLPGTWSDVGMGAGGVDAGMREELAAYFEILADVLPALPKGVEEAAQVMLAARGESPGVVNFVTVVACRRMLELTLEHRFLKNRTTRREYNLKDGHKAQLRQTVRRLLQGADGEAAALPGFLRGPMHRVVDVGNRAVHEAGSPTLAHAVRSANALLAVLRALRFVHGGVWDKHSHFLEASSAACALVEPVQAGKSSG